MNEFIIVFRESLEACLIVGIIYTLLEKNNLDREIKQLWLGVFFALIVSGILGILLNSIKQSIGNASIQALFESVFMFLTAGLLWYVIFWLSKHVSDRDELEGQTKKAIATSGIGVFLVVFFAMPIREFWLLPPPSRRRSARANVITAVGLHPEDSKLTG